MLVLEKLVDYLRQSKADFEIIKHSEPIIKTEDAKRYFDITKAAPVFVIETDNGLCALIVNPIDEKIDLKKLGKKLGFNRFKLADKKNILEKTGYEAGSIPLVGHNLPCYLDGKIASLDYIYGGTGDSYHTLKISVKDFILLNKIISIIEIS